MTDAQVCYEELLRKYKGKPECEHKRSEQFAYTRTHIIAICKDCGFVAIFPAEMLSA